MNLVCLFHVQPPEEVRKSTVAQLQTLEPCVSEALFVSRSSGSASESSSVDVAGLTAVSPNVLCTCSRCGVCVHARKFTT